MNFRLWVVHEDKKQLIFKPLSKTKPLLTPLFSLSEVYWSNIINKYFDDKTPIYHLAICKGISDDIPKYYEKGTTVPKIEKDNEKLVNLLELFDIYPDKNVNIRNYINYCGIFYDYTDILKSDFFKKNHKIAEELAFQILLSILKGDLNFHYENVSVIFKNNVPISLAPSIDHEFSVYFNNIDYLSKHLKYMYKITSAINFEDIKEDSERTINIKNNLEYIMDNYKEVVKKFIDCLQKLKNDIRYDSVRFTDNSFVEPFNSLEYLIGIARYKNNDEKHAEYLEKIIIKNEINLTNFSKRLNKDLLEIIDELIINLTKKNSKKSINYSGRIKNENKIRTYKK